MFPRGGGWKKRHFGRLLRVGCCQGGWASLLWVCVRRRNRVYSVATRCIFHSLVAWGLAATVYVCQSKSNRSGIPMCGWLLKALVLHWKGACVSTVGPLLASTCITPPAAFIQLAEESFASMAPCACAAPRGPELRSMRDAMANSAQPFDKGSVCQLFS